MESLHRLDEQPSLKIVYINRLNGVEQGEKYRKGHLLVQKACEGVFSRDYRCLKTNFSVFPIHVSAL